MKKLFTVIATFTFIIALEISPCLAESREQDCGSNKHRAEHTSEGLRLRQSAKHVHSIQIVLLL